MIKVIISDLDGTLTKIDALDFLTAQVCKEQNKKFTKPKEHKIGEKHLMQRINKLAGVNVLDIERVLCANKGILLKNNFSQFIDYIGKNKLDLIIISGNIEPVVKFYSNLFNASYYFFTEVDILENGQIVGMKKNGIRKNIKIVSDYLINKQIDWNDIIFIGNDTSDIPFWNSTNNSILFAEHKEILNRHVTFETNGDFLDLITILESIIKRND